MAGNNYIEEALLEVLTETDLLGFKRKLCVELQLSRLDHFEHVHDDELKALAGLSAPAIRRLRAALIEKRKRKKTKPGGLFGTVNKPRSDSVRVVVTAENNDQPTSTCLIGKDQIKLMERLGEGSFAVVKRAIWTDSTGQKIDVAVKILRDSTPAVIEDLQLEVNNMRRLQHPNLVRLHGIVFANPAMMVVELCDGGALLDRLRSTDKPRLLANVLLDYALQVAKGMSYLESRRCVHRDLAARNILLTDNERMVKIGDFGLMRVLTENERLYVMSAQKKVPFSWCPPESLRHRQFSHASDVWAYGVILWEFFSYGEEPWIGLRGADVLAKVEAGERLPKPRFGSHELYDLMLLCWSLDAQKRPRFSLLKEIIKEVQFMIGECREAHSPASDPDLQMLVNDKIIIIEGSGSKWFGQNVRTRCYGTFARSAVFVRSERQADDSPHGKRISRPIQGSFIHAGHGDATGGQSWGQPDRIDDIYLRNPLGNSNTTLTPSILGAQMIPSVISMQSSSSSTSVSAPQAEHKTPGTNSTLPRGTNGHRIAPPPPGPGMVKYRTPDPKPYQPSIDPFAPFDDDDLSTVGDDDIRSVAPSTSRASSAFGQNGPRQMIPESNSSRSPAASPPPLKSRPQSAAPITTILQAYDTPPIENYARPVVKSDRKSPVPPASKPVVLKPPPALTDARNSRPRSMAASINENRPSTIPSVRSEPKIMPLSTQSIVSERPKPTQLPPKPTAIEANSTSNIPDRLSPPFRESSPAKNSTVIPSSQGNIVPAKSTPSPSNLPPPAKAAEARIENPAWNITAPVNSTSHPVQFPSTTSTSTSTPGISPIPTIGGPGKNLSPSVNNANKSVAVPAIVEAMSGLGKNPISSTVPNTLGPGMPAAKGPIRSGTVELPAFTIPPSSTPQQNAITGPDPFEVPSSALRIANQERYSSVFVDKTPMLSTNNSAPMLTHVSMPSASSAHFGLPMTTTTSTSPSFSSTTAPIGGLGHQVDPHRPYSSQTPISTNSSYSGALVAELQQTLLKGTGSRAIPPAASLPTTNDQLLANSSSAPTLATAKSPTPAAATSSLYTSRPPTSSDIYGSSLYPDLSKTFASSTPTTSLSSTMPGHWPTAASTSNGWYGSGGALPAYAPSPLVSLATNNFSSLFDFGNNQALIFNAQSSQNRSVQPSTSMSWYPSSNLNIETTAPQFSSNRAGILQPMQTYPNPTTSLASSAERDSVLAMFDPLVTSSSNTSSNSSTMGSAVHPPTATSSTPTPVSRPQTVNLPPVSQSQPVSRGQFDLQSAIEEVHRRAIFATRERCATALRRYNNDVEKTIRELKVEKLLDLGLVLDRTHAENTLASVGWDVNAAAEKLLA